MGSKKPTVGDSLTPCQNWQKQSVAVAVISNYVMCWDELSGGESLALVNSVNAWVRLLEPGTICNIVFIRQILSLCPGSGWGSSAVDSLWNTFPLCVLMSFTSPTQLLTLLAICPNTNSSSSSHVFRSTTLWVLCWKELNQNYLKKILLPFLHPPSHSPSLLLVSF